MTLIQLANLSCIYSTILTAAGAVEVKQDTSVPTLDPTHRLNHCLWMLNEVRVLMMGTTVEDRDIAKAERWICFVQGVLWSANLRTVDEMREDNRQPV